MERRTSVEISEGSYLDLLSRGSRAGYLRQAVNEHLARVRAGLALLRVARGEDEVVALIEAASIPWARVGETDLPTLCREERAAVEDLWAEGEATGLGARELIAALESGRGA